MAAGVELYWREHAKLWGGQAETALWGDAGQEDVKNSFWLIY